jgi:hypothetical protein
MLEHHFHQRQFEFHAKKSRLREHDKKDGASSTAATAFSCG